MGSKASKESAPTATTIALPEQHANTAVEASGCGCSHDREDFLKTCASRVLERLNVQLSPTVISLLPTEVTVGAGDGVYVLTGFQNRVPFEVLQTCQDLVFPSAMLWVGQYMQDQREYYVGVFRFSEKDEQKLLAETVLSPVYAQEYAAQILRLNASHPAFFDFLSRLPTEIDRRKCISVEKSKYRIQLLDVDEDGSRFRLVLYGCIEFSVAAFARFLQVMAIPREQVTVCMCSGYLVIDIPKGHTFLADTSESTIQRKRAPSHTDIDSNDSKRRHG